VGATRDLAAFAAEADFDQLPADVVETLKVATLNILGCCLGGSQTRIGQLHVELAKEIAGGAGEATIVGDGARLSVPAAAYANASLGFALDYEDMIRYIAHPGHVTVAAALAVGERRRRSGRELLAALAAGYEVCSRIAIGVQPTPERGAEVWGEQYHTFAAAATAGRLLELDADRMEIAFGIAGAYTSVPSAYKYFGPVSETRPMREVKLGWGWNCLAGVVAALSAERGFGGGYGVLDGRHGFWIMHGSDRCDYERMLAGLGESWLTLETEFKIHPSIGVNHPAYWATKQLVEEHDVRPDDVEGVRVTTLWADRIGDHAPRGEVDAQFSLPYTIASTILREPLGPALYAQQKRDDPALLRLLAKIEVIPDPEADRLFFEEQRLLQTVEVRLVGGKLLQRAIDFPRDKPAYGKREVEQKFEDLAAQILDPTRRARVRAIVDRLEGIEEINELTALLG
jgi:2-methylcitrate dehydratase PrpD